MHMSLLLILYYINSEKTSCFRQNIDFHGADISRFVNASSAGDCQSKCLADSQCKVFSFQPSLGFCWRKRGHGYKVEKQRDRISGPANCGKNV